AFLQAREDVLELHHPGIGEHQGRIVARHERRGRHDLMTVGRKVIEKSRSDVVDAAHEILLSLHLPGGGGPTRGLSSLRGSTALADVGWTKRSVPAPSYASKLPSCSHQIPQIPRRTF